MKNKINFFSIAIIAAFIIFSLTSAYASMIGSVSLEELSALTPQIVEGRVVDKYETSSDPQHPYTHYVFKITQVLKGSHSEGEEIIFSHYGGSVKSGKEYVGIMGMPKLDVGGRYILFLRGRTNVACPFNAWSQGIFKIQDDNSVINYGGEYIDIINGSLKNTDTPVSLEAFKQKLSGVIKQSAGKTKEYFTEQRKAQQQNQDKKPQGFRVGPSEAKLKLGEKQN